MSYKYKISLGGVGGTFCIGNIDNKVVTWWKENHPDEFIEYLNAEPDEREEFLEDMFDGDEDKISEFEDGIYNLEESYGDIIDISTVSVDNKSYFEVHDVNNKDEDESLIKHFDEIKITNDVYKDYDNHPYTDDNKSNIDLNVVKISDEHLDLIKKPLKDNSIIYHFKEIRGLFEFKIENVEKDPHILETDSPFDFNKINLLEIMWIEDDYFVKSFTYENKKFISDNMPEGDEKGFSISVPNYFD